jgi:hypothetical protein
MYSQQASLIEGRETGTYSRGFFFGPGFPLGFGKTSPIWFRLLLFPGLGPGMPFLRGVGAAGVEAASEALSTEEGGATGSADVEEGDAISLLWFSLLGFSLLELSLLEFFLLLDEVTLLGKRLRRPGASLRTTVLFDRSDFVDRPFDEEVGVVVTAGMVVISPGRLCFQVLWRGGGTVRLTRCELGRWFSEVLSFPSWCGSTRRVAMLAGYQVPADLFLFLLVFFSSLVFYSFLLRFFFFTAGARLDEGKVFLLGNG